MTDTPAATQEITIQGVVFSAPAPYAEGHTLNAKEAAALNQTFGENLRNNFAKTVKAAQEAAEKAGEKSLSSDTIMALHTEFAKYAEGYEFQGGRRAAAPKDPILATALKLAREKVVEKIREAGKKVSDYKDGTVDTLAEQLVEKNPWFKQEAQRRHEAAASAADISLDGAELEPAPAQAAE